MDTNILVAYFSHRGENYFNGSLVNLSVGNTEIAAKIIAELTGGELFFIDPLKKYSQDYDACTKEARAELNAQARPQLVSYPENVNDVHTLILCYPNWWGTMPMAVFTFLERYDLSGKTILPLCTHEGSGMGRSEEDIRKVCPLSSVKKGLAIRGSKVNDSEKDIQTWLRQMGLLQ